MGLSSEDSPLCETTDKLMIPPPITVIQASFLSFAVRFHSKVCRKEITLKTPTYLPTLSGGDKVDQDLLRGVARTIAEACFLSQ